ncbi:hypothetical protein Pint_18037 [Pistacia integerrima]|uniref:Uncharacterized protein n=1 Tax=Pistacia integerrima TaxID=434235 RepID=A0ACC0YUI6_9ROSI|nr:hypothetical protein Pint_18037 [Pistacia integerrima]
MMQVAMALPHPTQVLILLGLRHLLSLSNEVPRFDGTEPQLTTFSLEPKVISQVGLIDHFAYYVAVVVGHKSTVDLPLVPLGHNNNYPPPPLLAFTKPLTSSDLSLMSLLGIVLAHDKGTRDFFTASVSKHWLSLISSPHFLLHLSRIPQPITGLFMRRLSHPEYYFINLSSSPSPPPFKHLSFGNNPSNSGITIQQSCNGLLLCRGPNGKKPRDHFVYNPTSQKYTLLPPPPMGNGVCCLGFNLAFDPSTSPHYKVICVRNCNDFADDNGVFWNGSIHWIHERDKSLYFNIDEEKIQQMPMPPLPDGRDKSIALTSIKLQQRFLKWVVAISIQGTFNYYKFSTQCVVREENEKDSYLVVHLPGKVIRYNFKNKTFRKIYDFVPSEFEFECDFGDGSYVTAIEFGRIPAFQHTHRVLLVFSDFYSVFMTI